MDTDEITGLCTPVKGAQTPQDAATVMHHSTLYTLSVR